MESYYRAQAGGNIPAYSMQEGRGLFGNLFRLAVPLIKAGARKALPHVIRAGKRVVRDIAQGQSVSSSLKKHAIKAAGEALSSVVNGPNDTSTKRKSSLVNRTNRVKRSCNNHEAF